MKKFLRFLLVLILVLVAVWLVLALYEPQDKMITRSILIKAPKEAVFEQIMYFKNWPNWSPWYKMDSTMKLTYTGADGQPGSSYQWESITNKTGSGVMKNAGVEGTSMNFEVTFIKPMSGNAHGILKAEDTAGITKATWTFNTHTGFPMNAIGAFINMDKMLGGEFEMGLTNMKQYVESHASATPGIEIKEVDYPAHIFEGIRKTVYWTELSKFFDDSYRMIAKDIGGKISGPGAGLFYNWDTTNKQADVAAVFPVSDTTMPVKGYNFFAAGPAKAVMAVEKGPYSSSMKYHAAIMNYMTAKGQKHSLIIEDYISGPVNEPDSNKWVTNIYYLVQ